MIKRRVIEPDVTFVNLIDVTLVLLIIFMITAPAMHDMVQVKLPKGKASKANIRDGIVVTVSKEGDVFIDKEKIGIDAFEAKFTEIWGKRAGEPIFVRGDEQVPYGDVMAVLATLKSIGGENVGLVIEERLKTIKK